MDAMEDPRVCGQCNKEVAGANFALHETHCHRFLRACPDCGESVPRDQLKQHKLDEHTQVHCPKCHQRMERRFLTDHESDECVERLQSCVFCELDMPWRKLAMHNTVCGSRTELCQACLRYVTLRDQSNHSLTCSGLLAAANPPLPHRPHHQNRRTVTTKTSTRSNEQQSVICIGCMKFFPAEDMEEHKLGCVPEWHSHLTASEEEEENKEEEKESGGAAAPSRQSWSLKALSLTDRALASGPREHPEDPDRISPCLYCHLALPQATLRWHQAKCRTNFLWK